MQQTRKLTNEKLKKYLLAKKKKFYRIGYSGFTLLFKSKEMTIFSIIEFRLLWGHKSETADEACFLQFNMGGTPSGNCGVNKFLGGLKKCERE